jgi:hypothetical protein
MKKVFKNIALDPHLQSEVDSKEKRFDFIKKYFEEQDYLEIQIELKQACISIGNPHIQKKIDSEEFLNDFKLSGFKTFEVIYGYRFEPDFENPFAPDKRVRDWNDTITFKI